MLDKMNKISVRKYDVIDLHLHLDGSLSVQTVRALADMQGIRISEDDMQLLQRLQVRQGCRDLNEYLEKFEFPLSLLQTKEGIIAAVCDLTCELKKQGLLYAEIRFAPQLHTRKGLTQEQVVEAAVEGLRRSDFRSNLILCCMRGDDNKEENLENVRVAKKYLGQGVCAIDIAGAEALFATEKFADIFELASTLGVPYTIHAGEADGPRSVYAALSYGAKRIGHGVRAIEDEALMKKLAEERITLELCPTSNLNTGIFKDLKEYPLRAFMRRGIRVTVNTDNMTVSGTSLQREFQKLIDTFSLTEDELMILARNALEASFADQETKDWIRGNKNGFEIRR